MRFVILTQYFPPEVGAPQTRLAAFARELRRSGHDVEIVTASRHKLYERDSWEGMTVHRCWSYTANGTGLRRILNYLSFTISSLVGLLRAHRSEYIFVESPPLFLCVPAWIAASLRGRSRKSRLIFNVADLWPDSVEDLGILHEGFILRCARALEKWAYKKSDYVTGVTEGICETLARKGVPRAKLLFLPNGVDTITFAPREPDQALIDALDVRGKKVLLFAGTHGIAQGLETLIETAQLLRDEAFVFVFVGDGGRKSVVQNLAERLGLTNVRFVDSQQLSEMPRYFSIAYASIVPLLRLELFTSARPSKIFPSLASGIPVIYCGEGEAATLLATAHAGITVAPESPQALADGIRKLGNDAQFHARMSHNARLFAVAHCAWPSLINDWLCALQASQAETKIPMLKPEKAVAISGLPFFVEELFGKSAERSTGWKHRFLRFNNRFQSIAAVWNLTKSRVWYSVGSMFESRLCEAYASLMHLPRIVHWVGSDITRARTSPALLRRLRKQHVLHLTETAWIGEELRSLGLASEIAPLPPVRIAREVPALPSTFTVLLYVPATRSEFYGSHIYEQLREEFKDLPVRFLTVEGGSDPEQFYPETTVLLRMTEHDGLSLMVLEALSFGRYVIWPHDFPFVTNAATYSAVKAALNRLLEAHLAGTLEPQYAAAAHIHDAYGRDRCLQRIATYWDASLPHVERGHERVSLPI